MAAVAARVNSEFRTQGLSLRGDAMRLLCDFLRAQEDVGEALMAVLSALLSRSLESSLVCVEDVQAVLGSLSGGAGADGEGDEGGTVQGGPLVFVDAFAVPRVAYDSVRKLFHSVPAPPRVLAAPESKLALLRERFNLLAQRLARNKLFSRPALRGVSTGSGYCEVTPLQALLGTAGETRFVLGALSQLEEGRFWLEDCTGSVGVDLTDAATSAGLFTEGCVVLAEGELRRDGIFQARALGFPPCEPRRDSLQALGSLDLFGAGHLRADDRARLEASGAAAGDEMWVLLADIFMDQPLVVSALRRVLDAFDAMEVPPALFVLMGDFLSTPFSPTSSSLGGAKAAFAALAQVLGEYPDLLSRSRFAFMPGPADAGCAAALPRPPLPRSLTRALRGAVPGAVFASNPCRLRWHATEVVLFREDIAGRMRRACVRSPAEEGGGDGGAAGGTPGERLFGAVCATVLQQGHLAPLPLPHAPVFWEWDHALWLYPLPHALLLADRSVPQASCAFEDVAAANPGSFGTDGSFAVFRPAQRTFELSAVPLSA